MKEGILYYSNKAIKYIGSFFDNKYNGEGILYDENGDYYEGKFENGQKWYEGKEFYKNEKLKYKGYFLNNKYEGEGKLFNKDGGLIQIGEFLNGKIIFFIAFSKILSISKNLRNIEIRIFINYLEIIFI